VLPPHLVDGRRTRHALRQPPHAREMALLPQPPPATSLLVRVRVRVGVGVGVGRRVWVVAPAASLFG
jgi:hypothetical protein